MDDSLRALLRDLEVFGAENDARAGQRQDKMLNITPETGEFLAILVCAAKSRRVLEIGTSNGYSTLWLADAAGETSGGVVTLECSAAKAEMARRNFERSGLSSRIELQVVDAGEFLRRESSARFDLVFLDSDRQQYSTWWPSIQKAIAPGGVLVVDNAVSHAPEMADFVARVQATPGWRSVVVPIGNGELVAQKRAT